MSSPSPSTTELQADSKLPVVRGYSAIYFRARGLHNRLTPLRANSGGSISASKNSVPDWAVLKL